LYPFKGGFLIVSPLLTTTSPILALVGSGCNPKFPSNRVVFWNDFLSKGMGELRFKERVRNVLLRKDRIVIVLEYIVYVYEINFQIADQLQTVSNPRGCASVNRNMDLFMLAIPSTNVGELFVKKYDVPSGTRIKAHESNIQIIQLSNDGKLVATGNEAGTIIRVFQCEGNLIYEFRRGTNSALLSSL